MFENNIPFWCKKHKHNHIFFYTYDQYGNLSRIVDEDDNSIEYVYDETQRLEKYAYVIGTYQREVNFYYDQTSGRADYMQYEVGGMNVRQEFDYDQDSLQRVRSIDTLIGTTQLTESFIYDDSMVNSNYGNATMRIYAIEYAKNDVTQSKHTFFYDEMHNIVDKIIYNELNAVIERHTYNYDGFSRLIRENLYVEGATPDVTRVFAYDSLGNITSIQDYAYTLSQEITTSPYKESHLTYTNPSRPDQLSMVTHKSNGTITHTTSYTYDASGNPSAITDSRGSFYSIDLTFDGRELVGYQRDDVMDVSYTYDDQGIRKTKVVDGVLHAYTTDQGRVIAESIGSNTHLYYTYDGSGRLFSMNYNGTEYFYRLSLQGDVIGLYDAYGNEVASYIYDAYGNEIRATGILKDINPYRYRSYRFEEETGYYYLQSRYYDPSIGRFISQDGMGYLDPSNHAGLNLYQYCANNPVMYLDSTGNSPEWWHWVASAVMIVAGIALMFTPLGILGGALVTASVSAMVGGYLNEQSGGSFTAGWVGGAVAGFVSGLGVGMASSLYYAATISSGGAIFYGSGSFAIAGTLGFLGNFGGNIITQSWDNKQIDLTQAFVSGIIGGILNVGFVPFSAGANALSKFGYQTLSVGYSILMETTSQVASYGINQVMNGVYNYRLNRLIRRFG